jgi:hypothetical protein
MPGPVRGCAGAWLCQFPIRHPAFCAIFIIRHTHNFDVELLSGVLSIIPAFIKFFGPGILVTGTHRVRCVAVPVRKSAPDIYFIFINQHTHNFN